MRHDPWIATALLPIVLGACEGARDARPEAEVAPSAAAASAPRDSARARVLRAVRARLPGFDVDLADEVQRVGATSLSWTMARYARRGGEWPYGRGFVVWHQARPDAVWLYTHDGDFGPHTLAWRDVNGDALPDLVFLSGEEEVFETGVFVLRDTTAPVHDRSLVPVYADSNDYATLVDLDGDGVPELLDPNVPGTDHPERLAEESCDAVEVPPDVTARAQAEYERVGRPFADVNFTYGFASHGYATLHLTRPVRVLQFRGAEVRDATATFPGHLRWRIALLEEVNSTRPPECRAPLDSTLAYLRARLRGPS